MPSLTPGTEVSVRTFGNKRGVIVAHGRDGRYQVRVERVTIWCREADLAVSEQRGRLRRPRPSRPAPSPTESGGGEAPPRRVDLHGLTVQEAMATVLQEMDRALLAGADRLEVVHGKGSGRIRAALHRYLAGVAAVAAFRLDPRNPGVTWVHFR